MVKERLANMPMGETEEAEAELYAAVVLSARLIMRGRGKVGLKFSFYDADLIKRVYKLLKEVFSIRAEMSVSKINSFGQKQLYTAQVNDSAEAYELLRFYERMDSDGFLTATGGFDLKLLKSEEAKKAFLRGAVEFCGYIADPMSSYLFQFTFSEEKLAQDFSDFLASYGTEPKIRTKNNDIIVYVKKAEDVGRILAEIDESYSYLKLNDALIIKEIKNVAHRAANCDMANAEKAESASNRQCEAINQLIREGRLTNLNEQLIKTAQLRLENPGMPLKEMCRLFEPPIPKSTLNNRLATLIRLAELNK